MPEAGRNKTHKLSGWEAVTGKVFLAPGQLKAYHERRVKSPSRCIATYVILQILMPHRQNELVPVSYFVKKVANANQKTLHCKTQDNHTFTI